MGVAHLLRQLGRPADGRQPLLALEGLGDQGVPPQSVAHDRARALPARQEADQVRHLRGDQSIVKIGALLLGKRVVTDRQTNDTYFVQLSEEGLSTISGNLKPIASLNICWRSLESF